MKPNLNKMVERIEVFKAAWQENAPDAVFSGMTLAEFTEASKGPGDLRGEIRMLVQQASRKRVDSLSAIANAGELLDLVVNSVRGTPGFGPDCALYRAFGYIRKSERKSGLTRKSVAPPEDEAMPSTDAS